PHEESAFPPPAVAIWEVVVIDLGVDPQAPPLAAEYGPPKTFGIPRGKDTKKTPAVVLDPKREIWEVNKDMSALAPPRSGRSAEEQAALDNLPLEERNARLLKMREASPVEKFLSCWTRGGSLPEDLKLKDAKFNFGALAPQRNGCFDIFYARGAMDYVLRLPQAFARLSRFRVRDAPLYGALRQSPGMGLQGGLHWRELPLFDCLLFTGIPHCAIGAENCYALQEYLKAGGAALFTGGEYAFGKGGYMHTVLDRAILPILCVENVDTRYSEEPLALEPGPHFSDLRVEVDFAAKPSFWVYNEVALKPDKSLKIFLKAGNRPILVGWELGRGRVACLLLDHRGKSEGQVTAFFDWRDWPALMHALFLWLAPNAMATEAAPPRLAAEETKKLIDFLEEESLVADLEGAKEDRNDLLEEEAAAKPARELTAEEKKKRLQAIERLLLASGKEAAAALAGQIAVIADLPLETRFAIMDFIRRYPPPNLAALAKRCLTSQDPAARGCGLQMLALAGDAAFPEQACSAPPASETDPVGRGRDLALAIALFAKPDLCAEGKRRVQEWNKLEAEGRAKWTGGKPFSLANPHHHFLDAEATLQRAAWLAYLVRHEAPAFAAQFCHEWLMLAQYQDYCDRSIANLYDPYGMSVAKQKIAAGKDPDWRRLRAYFGRLRDLTWPDMESAILKQPEQAAAGMVEAHFTLEFQSAMNILGSVEKTAALPVLEKLKKAANADLAAFAQARAASK
ncbi:MAG: hypothetical protein N3A66_04685, partial [Planctomycetota bacterium]|nr:hypothetical protein [Planctomycetota bacterium]